MDPPRILYGSVVSDLGKQYVQPETEILTIETESMLASVNPEKEVLESGQEGDSF